MQAARQRSGAPVFEGAFIPHLRLFAGFEDLSDKAGKSAESLATCFGVELLAPLRRRGKFEKRQGSLRRSGRFVNRQGPLHQNSPHPPLALAEESGSGPGERRRSPAHEANRSMARGSAHRVRTQMWKVRQQLVLLLSNQSSPRERASGCHLEALPAAAECRGA